METSASVTETSRIRLAFYIIITVIVLIIGAYCVSAQTPTPFDASKIDYSQFTPQEIAKTEAHRNELKGKLNDLLQSVETTVYSQGVTLEQVQESLLVTKTSFQYYQQAAEAQITKGNQAIAALDHVLSQLHRAKLLACALWIAAVAFLAMKLPPPLSIYVGGGAAVAGVAAIWMWL